MANGQASEVGTIGNEGAVTAEETKSLEIELEIVEGMQFDPCYICPCLIFSAPVRHAEDAADHYLAANGIADIP